MLHDPAETKGASGCLQSVAINGQPAKLMTGGTPDQRSAAIAAAAENAWYYNENINISFIKVNDVDKSIEVTAQYC